MFISASIKKTLQTVKKHKWLFLILFLTQLAFIIIFLLVQFKYQVAIVQDYQDILTLAQSANYNTTQLQTGMPFLEDTTKIIALWSQIQTNFITLLFFSFITFLIFNGFNWSLSHYLIKKQNFLHLWAKFIAFSALFFVPYLILIFSVIKISILHENPVISAQIMIVLAFVFIYFALTSFSLIDLKLKKNFRKTFWEIGVKNFYLVLLIYLVVFLPLALISYLLYHASMFWHISLVILIIILLILLISTFRIFLINSIKEI